MYSQFMMHGEKNIKPKNVGVIILYMSNSA